MDDLRVITAAFKLNCSRKACGKHGTPSGCPHGSSCFYMHGEGGRDEVGGTVRVKVGEGGVKEGIGVIELAGFLSDRL